MRFFLTILLLGFGPGWALAQPLDTARHAFAAATEAETALATTRRRVAGRHERLAQQISALKQSSQGLAPSLAKVELGQQLRLSRSLSTELDGLDREVAAATDRLQQARASLQAALDLTVGTQQRALATAQPTDRRAVFETIKNLLEERSRLQTSPIALTVALPAILTEVSTPDELRELADEAQDNAEKVQSRLGALDSRLDFLRQRRRLLGAAAAFQRDTSLFADDQRNRRILARPTALVSATARRPDKAGEAAALPEIVDAPPGETQADEGDQPNGPPSRSSDPTPEQGDPSFAAGGGGEDKQHSENDMDGAEPAESPEIAGVTDPDGQGVFFPEPAAVVHDVGLPAAPADLGRALVVEDVMDPALLAGQTDGLSSGAVTQQIRALEGNRLRLQRAAQELAARRLALEAAAEALENQ